MKNSESFAARKTTMAPIRQLWKTMYLPLQAVLWRTCEAMARARAIHETAMEAVNVNSRKPFIMQLSDGCYFARSFWLCERSASPQMFLMSSYRSGKVVAGIPLTFSETLL